MIANDGESESRSRHTVLWLPLGFVFSSIIYGAFNQKVFLNYVTMLNRWVLTTFGPLFSLSVALFFFFCLVVYFSKLGDVRIGGKYAQPIFSKSRWISVALCTTIATGILFWACAEPLYHFTSPPDFARVEGMSKEARDFALSTLFFHWSFLPYGIYTTTGLVFAICHYNLSQPFSLSSALVPLFGSRMAKSLSVPIDILCLITLVAGMSASLGTGILTLNGGINFLFGGMSANFLQMVIIVCLIVFAFVLSSITGIQKGIRVLSQANVLVFAAMLLSFLIFGNATEVARSSVFGVLSFLRSFPERVLLGPSESGHLWVQSWTIFYWANWLAWTPITAMFLGKIARGFTVKEFIRVNLFYPSLFAIFWMSVFGGTTLFFQEHGVDLLQTLKSSGPEFVVYQVIARFPFSFVLTILFLFAVFISFVTAADSNTNAMASLCVEGGVEDMRVVESPLWIKVAWGVGVGIMALIMVGTSGVDGVKMLSNLGGLPSLLLINFIAMSGVFLVLDAYRNRL